MRLKVPADMQGRAISTRNTLQFFTIPAGLYLGGALADGVFEPLMRSESFLKTAFSAVVGTGKGSGTAVIFLAVGLAGFIVSMAHSKKSLYRELD
jgi:hypothetical protein